MNLKFTIFIALIVSTLYYSSCNIKGNKNKEIEIIKEDTLTKVLTATINEVPKKVINSTDNKANKYNYQPKNLIPFHIIIKTKNGYTGPSYGFKDSNGKVITPPTFQMLSEFNEGIMRVMKNDKYGFIDTTGAVVIPIIYSNINYDDNGLMRAEKNGKWGEINTKGDIIVSFNYDYLHKEYNELRLVSINKKIGYIDKSENVVVPFIYDNGQDFNDGIAAVKIVGKYGCINKTGNTIIPFIYDYISEFSNGIAYIKYNSKYAFINKYGNIMVPTIDNIGTHTKTYIYDQATRFYDGISSVFIGEIIKERFTLNSYDYKTRSIYKGKYGFVNDSGKQITSLIYDEASVLEKGMSKVKKGDKWGFINAQGIEYIPLIYDEIKDFRNGIAKVKLNGKYGFIDKKGNIQIPITNDGINRFTDSLFISVIDDKFGIIDINGKTIVPYIYDMLTWSQLYPNHPIKVKIGNKFGFISSKGKKITECKYDELDYYKGGRNGPFKARINNKWGIIDISGKILAPCIYNGIGQFDKERFGYAVICKAKKGSNYSQCGLISKSGKVITECKYRFIRKSYNNFIVVGNNEKLLGYIDSLGNEICECKYKYLYVFEDGTAITEIRESVVVRNSFFSNDYHYGLVNNGKEVLPIIYQSITRCSNGLFRLKLNDLYGFADKNGEIIIPIEYYGADNDFIDGKVKIFHNGEYFYLDINGNIVE